MTSNSIESTTDFLKSLPNSISNSFNSLLNSSKNQYNKIPTNLINNYGSTSNSTEGNQVLPSDPSKIEPKVWLASERTLLNYFRVSLLISSFSLALFNSAKDGDWITKGMGITYCGIALGMLLYAWLMQERRRKRIMERYPGHHDDLIGPVVICGVIFVAVLVNFILRVQQREELRDHKSPKSPWLTSFNLVQEAFSLNSTLQ